MIISLIICFLFLLISIAKFKLNSFISLLVAAVFLGIANGLSLEQIPSVIYDGFGGQIKSLALLIVFGAVLGQILNKSGASSQIAETILRAFGKRNIQLALLCVALIIGITMFFEAAFIVLIPIIYSLAQKTNYSPIYIGLPGVIGLSITHSFLPPHPGPALVCNLYEADIGLTLFFGILLVLPNAFLTGILYSNSDWIDSINSSSSKEFLSNERCVLEEMPSFSVSILCILTPIVLIAAPTIFKFMGIEIPIVFFIGSPPLAMLIGVFLAIYFLCIRQGMSIQKINALINNAVQSVAMLILIIGAGGAFKQIVVDTGIGNYIGQKAIEFDFSPLITAWALAAIIRCSVGSATIAITIAAGIMVNVVQTANLSPEIMVLATSTGSIFASHVNDPGFWLFKEYFHLPLIDALKIRTVYTILLSVMGLIGVLIINYFLLL